MYAFVLHFSCFFGISSYWSNIFFGSVFNHTCYRQDGMQSVSKFMKVCFRLTTEMSVTQISCINLSVPLISVPPLISPSWFVGYFWGVFWKIQCLRVLHLNVPFICSFMYLNIYWSWTYMNSCIMYYKSWANTIISCQGKIEKWAILFTF